MDLSGLDPLPYCALLARQRLDTGSLDLETDFDDESLSDTFLGWGQSVKMPKDICANCSFSFPSRQVVRAAWAVAAFAFGYLVFIFVCAAAAASAGACFISLSLEGVFRAAVALMTVTTLGGSVTASFKLPSMFFDGSGAALVSVSAAAFMLLCAATAVAVAGAFGTVVVCALPYDLADGGFMRISVFVMMIVSTGVFTLVGFYFHFAGLQPAIEEALQQAAAAGGHHASEAQATPRVDVGDPPEASSFHQATGSHDTKDEESTKVQKFQVFVKNLAGKTVVVRGLTGMDEVSLVVGQVESLTGVPRSLFYLVGASGRRIWEDVTLEQCGLGPDSSLIMTARLLGGSMRQRAPLVPGSWTCNNCNMGGCLPSRNVCFRCLAPRPTNGPRFSSPTPARETQHLGRAPPVQRTGNPTVRRGTAPPQPQPVHRGKPDMAAALKGDGMAVLKTLRELGISEALLEQVQASLVPKRTDPGNARERALADNKAQLTALRVRIGRQEHSVANAKESLNRASEKLLHLRHEHEQLLAQYIS